MKKTNIKGILEITLILIIILSLLLLFIPNTEIEKTTTNQTNKINNDDFLNSHQNNQDQGLIQKANEHTELFCKDLCGNGFCDEFTQLDVNSTCYETAETCPLDCD